jgi:hypothetical protein
MSKTCHTEAPVRRPGPGDGRHLAAQRHPDLMRQFALSIRAIEMAFPIAFDAYFGCAV